ncbi:MAG: type II toxin-antitoxin system HicA family toxin [Bdellovibrionales bacterium]
MNHNEFKRHLQKLGCTFTEGTKHTIVHFGQKHTTMPRHGKKEIGKGIAKAIKKQLGIED